MLRTVEAVIDEQGQVRLLETVPLVGARRALVTILDDEPVEAEVETAHVSEAPLSEVRDRLRAYHQVLRLAESLRESGVMAGELFQASREELEARS